MGSKTSDDVHINSSVHDDDLIGWLKEVDGENRSNVTIPSS